MWPFKKKQPERDFTGESIAKLEAFRKVGETFNYLGRTCIVTGYWEYWLGIGVIPLLQFDYVDELGKLHSASARVAELPALINQQMPNVRVEPPRAEEQTKSAALSRSARTTG